MIYIFHDAFSYSRYILGEIRDMECVTCIEMPSTKGFKRTLHKWSKHLPLSLYTPIAHKKDVMETVRLIKPDDTVILFDFWNYVNAKYLLKHLKCHTVHVWFWNTLADRLPRIFSLNTDKKLLFHTFDPKDAIRQNMHLHNQFYREPEQKEEPTEEIFDFFFVGLDKGRLDTLRNLSNRLSGWGFTTKFIIVDRRAENGVIDGIEYRNKEVEYEETLRLIRQSKVLVDCTKSKQTGITLRVLEGLFLNKKVISNNPEIKKLPFYNPSRFLLMDDLSSDEAVRSFMNLPFSVPTAEEKEPFEIKHWLKEIITSQ